LCIVTAAPKENERLDRLSTPARQALSRPQEEARNVGHTYLDTEQLLLAFAGQPEGTAAAAVKALGVDHGALRRAVGRIIERGSPLACGSMPLTPRLKRMLELAG